MAEIVQVQVAEGQAAPFVFRQARRQQGLEALAVGDAGQGVVFGQTLQGVLQVTPLADMAQGAAQGVQAKVLAHQPVTDSAGRCLRLVFKQQNSRQLATPGGGLQGGCCQHDGLTIMAEQAVDRLPVWRSQ
ncbi:hypothetical protein D9M71_484150 [compost metagenome]